ncbi:MAG: endonuclease/exonuclease/phosphatase family protein [Bdellovibrionota bacterium]
MKSSNLLALAAVLTVSCGILNDYKNKKDEASSSLSTVVTPANDQSCRDLIKEQNTSNSYILKVLSYNVKSLPFPAPGSLDRKKRMKRIGNQLAKRREEGNQPDIVLLQELFKSKSNLIGKAKYPYIQRGPEEGNKMLSSGIFTLSELPITYEYGQAYPEDACGDWDCKANKGFTHSKIQIPGAPEAINILNTHMQALREQSQPREAQIRMVAKYIEENIPKDELVIFAGDFNLKIDRPGYPIFKELTGFTDVGEYCTTNDNCQAVKLAEQEDGIFYQHTNDHHFGRVGKTIKAEPLCIDRATNPKGKKGEDSDHMGYEAHYRVTW